MNTCVALVAEVELALVAVAKYFGLALVTTYFHYQIYYYNNSSMVKVKSFKGCLA